MNSVFLRIWFLIFAFFTQTFIAQNYNEEVSEGLLEINSKKIPVQIFSSTDYSNFRDFAERTSEGNKLVILNNINFEPGDVNKNNYNEDVIEKYKKNGYQFLDKNFKPSDVEITPQTAPKFKYLYKGNELKLTGNETVKLNTAFKIWDPSTGIKLGPFTLHYYSLMFVLAFGLGYVLMSRMFKIDHVHEKYLEPLFIWTLAGTILGARIGHVVFYEPELFKRDFWSVFLPIRTQPEFEFTGFSGLASHGAAIMLILTTLYYSFKIIKKNPLWVYDRLGIVVALGGVFIRIGNFFNSEIIGKPADPSSPFAFLFPQMSDEYGLTVPRYPTQLFESFGYLCLFILLWFIYRYTNKKYQQGWLFGLFFVILWSIRFFVEFLKEPQGAEKITAGVLNSGQVLSIPFIIAGLVVMFVSKRYIITPEENSKPT